MRFTSFIAVYFSIAILVSLMGCASIGGGQISGVNWALEKNGGKVSAFSENAGHPVSTLINGITSSEGWNDGEGWEAPIAIGGGNRRRNSSRDQAQNWVIIDLAQPVTVSNVKIHTINTEEFPAESFGVNSLLIQCETESALKEKLWVSAERFGKGIGEQDNIIKGNAIPVIDVRFEPVYTQRIRILIYRTNDLEKGEGNSKALGGMIRITEIEVYGTGKQKAKDELGDLFAK